MVDEARSGEEHRRQIVRFLRDSGCIIFSVEAFRLSRSGLFTDAPKAISLMHPLFVQFAIRGYFIGENASAIPDSGKMSSAGQQGCRPS